MARRRINGELNTISDNLRKYRKARRFSQSELVRELHLLGIPIHKNDISKIEKKERVVRDYEVWGFMKALNINADELFYDIENKLSRNEIE